MSVRAAGLLILVLSFSPLVWFWGLEPDYLDRVIIVGVSIYLLLQLPQAGPRRILPQLGMIIGCFLIPPVWNLLAQVGPRSVLLWWLVLAFQLIALGWAGSRGGWYHIRLVSFPLLFLWFALPLPDRVQAPLQRQLQEYATRLSAIGLNTLGYEAKRAGFAIDLPSGRLEVVEACSGIRSTTALTALAAFLAYWQGLGLLRGVLLLLLSQPIIVLANIVRIVATGLIQEHFGRDFVQGFWHEMLGFATVLFGLGFILLASNLLLHQSVRSTWPTPASWLQNEKCSRVVTCSLALSCLFSLLSFLWGYNTRPVLTESADFSKIPLQLQEWQGQSLPTDAGVLDQLSPDGLEFREYRDPLGVRFMVWLMYWQNTTVMRGYHHPDVCWPNRGFEVTEATVLPIPFESENVPASLRVYAKGAEKHRILYWTQEGKRFWSEADEANLRAGGSLRWIGELLYTRAKDADRPGRIAVLVGCDRWSGSLQQQRAMDEFLQLLLKNLYETCSWAKPD